MDNDCDGSRRHIVQWQGARDCCGSTPGDITFEIVFNEASTPASNNVIDVIYQSLAGAMGTYSAGVQNEDGTLGANIPAPFTAPRGVRLTPSM